MTAYTFTKPYVVTAEGARQLEDALKSPSPRNTYAKKASVTTISDLAKKYGKQHNHHSAG